MFSSGFGILPCHLATTCSPQEAVMHGLALEVSTLHLMHDALHIIFIILLQNMYFM
jgi:hypothetical protein